MTNPVFEAARTVLAVREFDERPVPDDVIHRIVESAQLTASSRNGQPWHFVVVREREDLQQLGSLIPTGRYTASAAFAIIVAYDKGSPYGASDVSRAIQTMVLTAWAEGVGSNWTGFGGMDTVGKAFGVPADLDVYAVIPFGYPKRKLGLGRKNRKPLGEVVSEGRFGGPFS
jgi:nitroreductase